MRLDPKSREHAELVHRHWSSWFPGVDSTRVRGLRWRHGFVDALELRDPLPLELPVFRFLRSISISLPHQGSFERLSTLPLLRDVRVSLRWGQSLGALSELLRRAHRIELELRGAGGDGALDLHGDLPELRHFVLDAQDLPQQLLGNLMGAPWLTRLDSLVLGDIGNPNAGPLVNRGHVLERLGERLHFELRRDALPLQRSELRKKFPRARLRVPDHGDRQFPQVGGLGSPPGSGRRLPFAERGLWAVREPLDAPLNFRNWPNRLTEVHDGRPGAASGTFVSAGAGFGHLREDTRCAWCASDYTGAIFAQPRADRDGGRTWWQCEWVCEECGWVTTMRPPPDA